MHAFVSKKKKTNIITTIMITLIRVQFVSCCLFLCFYVQIVVLTCDSITQKMVKNAPREGHFCLTALSKSI